ncbi:hypothetical protein AB0M05_02115 [Streptomyces violaceusniger]|uniref:hypothetical protein n=1 Tax=Streptomyces violaceusniger TaxID=68280 RepID=UPI00341EDC30
MLMKFSVFRYFDYFPMGEPEGRIRIAFLVAAGFVAPGGDRENVTRESRVVGANFNEVLLN